MARQAIDRFRAEVRRRRFRRLTDAELAEAKRRALNAHHSNRIEGITPDADTAALFDVLIGERVPAEDWADLVLGFMQKQQTATRAA